jgi:uncharacterized Zn-binding protein involved in type VI secretion
MLPVARVTDVHSCPIHGPNTIVKGGMCTADGLPIARVGDMTACGATIVTGSSTSSENGQPIAYLGSTTSHGGVITTGSPMHKVMP